MTESTSRCRFRYHDADGGQEFTFPNVRSTISLKSLARGELRLRSLEVFGLEVFVVRDASGRLRLPSLPGEGFRLGKDLGKTIDELFDSGPLGHLDRIELTNSSIEFEDLESGTSRRMFLPGSRLTRSRDQLDLTSRVHFPADEPDDALALEFTMTRTPGAGTLVISSRLSRPVTTIGADTEGAVRTAPRGISPDFDKTCISRSVNVMTPLLRMAVKMPLKTASSRFMNFHSTRPWSGRQRRPGRRWNPFIEDERERGTRGASNPYPFPDSKSGAAG